MASQNISLLTLTVTATAAMAANRFVAHAGVHASAAGNALGVSRTAAAIGDVLPVDVIGTATVEAEAAIADGAALEVGTDGKAKTQSAGVTVARAVQAAANAGDLIEVLLIQN